MIDKKIFKKDVEVIDNFIYLCSSSEHKNQQHTNDVFSEKWRKHEESKDKNKLYDMQKNGICSYMVLNLKKNLPSF